MPVREGERLFPVSVKLSYFRQGSYHDLKKVGENQIDLCNIMKESATSHDLNMNRMQQS